MGPYCRFCDQRCFIHLPSDTPADMLAVYHDRAHPIQIVATCPAGQAYKRKTIGFSIDDIRRRIEDADDLIDGIAEFGFTHRVQ